MNETEWTFEKLLSRIEQGRNGATRAQTDQSLYRVEDRLSFQPDQRQVYYAKREGECRLSVDHEIESSFVTGRVCCIGHPLHLNWDPPCAQKLLPTRRRACGRDCLPLVNAFVAGALEQEEHPAAIVWR